MTRAYQSVEVLEYGDKRVGAVELVAGLGAEACGGVGYFGMLGYVEVHVESDADEGVGEFVALELGFDEDAGQLSAVDSDVVGPLDGGRELGELGGGVVDGQGGGHVHVGELGGPRSEQDGEVEVQSRAGIPRRG